MTELIARKWRALARSGLTAAAVLSTLAVGQVGFSQQRGLSGSVQHVNVNASSGKLMIQVAGLSPSASWTVGVITATVPQPKIDVLRATLGMGKIRAFESLAAWPLDQIQVADASITVTVPQGDPSSIGIFAQIPQNHQVQIVINGKLVTASTVSSSLLVRDGVIRNELLKSFAGFLMQMQIPERSPGPDIVQRQGRNLASVSAARAHLISFTKPVISATGSCCKTKAVLVRISVDENGTVTAVKRLQGIGEDIGPFETTVQTWRFTPFSLNGKAVPVEIVIPFVLGEGVLNCPLY